MLKVRRNGRKGFTLAELLIVVAIIAVLVAIAVPLFVGSLNKARDARDNANIRAVRGAAVVYLLEKSSDATLWGTAEAPVEEWDVTAEIGSNGEITSLSVAKKAEGSTKTEAGKVTEASGVFTVELLLKKTEIKDLT